MPCRDCRLGFVRCRRCPLPRRCCSFQWPPLPPLPPLPPGVTGSPCRSSCGGPAVPPAPGCDVTLTRSPMTALAPHGLLTADARAAVPRHRSGCCCHLPDPPWPPAFRPTPAPPFAAGTLDTIHADAPPAPPTPPPDSAVAPCPPSPTREGRGLSSYHRRRRCPLTPPTPPTPPSRPCRQPHQHHLHHRRRVPLSRAPPPVPAVAAIPAGSCRPSLPAAPALLLPPTPPLPPAPPITKLPGGAGNRHGPRSTAKRLRPPQLTGIAARTAVTPVVACPPVFDAASLLVPPAPCCHRHHRHCRRTRHHWRHRCRPSPPPE